MNILRDPIWQFVGVMVTILVALVPLLVWRFRYNRAEERTDQKNIITELKAHINNKHCSIQYKKHKKRKDDGILLSNLSMDFLNQFPLPIGILAAHLDRLYTPENFGSDNWLAVFKRLTSEGYFQTIDGSSWRRIKLNTMLIPSNKMDHLIKISTEIKRSVSGLE